MLAGGAWNTGGAGGCGLMLMGAGAACTLTYALTRRLRVPFAVGGPAGPGPKSLVLQYSSDA